MKILIPLVILSLLLSGCANLFPPPSEPTPSDSDMMTRVAQILTTMPTATGALPTEEIKAPSTPVVIVSTATQAVVTEPAATEPPAVEPSATQAPPATATQPPAAATATGGVPNIPVVTLTPGTSVTGTPVAGDPRTALGNPNWTDSMDDGDNWPTGSDKYTSIKFENGQLVLTALDELDGWRLSTPRLQNFYLEMTVKPGECTGSDHYGLIFRVPEPTEADQGYLYGFTCDGRYSLRRWNGRVGTKGEMKWLVNWTTDSSIAVGANQTHRIGVLAQGGRLTLYVNGQRLTQVEDSTFTGRGGFGVFVGMDNTDDFTIQVDQISYWEDPGM